MTDHLYIHLPPNTLMSDQLESLTVHWYDGQQQGQAALAELLASQPNGCAITLILSVADIHLSKMALTRQQARHLKRVLPFLLEEALLDPVETLRFASGRTADGDYSVAAVAAAPLQQLALFLRDAGGVVESILVDADLLASRAPARLAMDNDEWLLITGAESASVVDSAAYQLWQAANQDDDDAVELIEGDSIWPALIAGTEEKHRIELMQREWRLKSTRSGSESTGLWFSWRLTLVAAAVILVGVLVATGVQTWRYQTATEQLKQQTAQLYKQLFPQDRATAKVRAQFRNHLRHLGGKAGGSDFISLMRVAGPVLAKQKAQGTNPKRIQYNQRTGHLMLDIEAPDYEALRTLRDQLQAAHLTADISVAKARGDKVNARIKVGQG